MYIFVIIIVFKHVTILTKHSLHLALILHHCFLCKEVIVTLWNSQESDKQMLSFACHISFKNDGLHTGNNKVVVMATVL